MADRRRPGAAAEPEPEPDGKPTKKGGGAKGKAKAKGEGEEGASCEGNRNDDATHRCGNCDAPDAKSKCKGCGVEYYCGRECQTVRLGRVRTCLGGTRAGGGRSKRRRSGVPSKRRRSRLADTS